MRSRRASWHRQTDRVRERDRSDTASSDSRLQSQTKARAAALELELSSDDVRENGRGCALMENHVRSRYNMFSDRCKAKSKGVETNCILLQRLLLGNGAWRGELVYGGVPLRGYKKLSDRCKIKTGGGVETIDCYWSVARGLENWYLAVFTTPRPKRSCIVPRLYYKSC